MPNDAQRDPSVKMSYMDRKAERSENSQTDQAKG